jgi:hypothetical protein
MKNEIYKIALGWLNVFIFLRLTSLAANFVRIYTNAYSSGYSEIIMLLFAIAFFLCFRNLSSLVLLIPTQNEERLLKKYVMIGKMSVVLLFASLVLQLLPELLLTASLQIQ